MAIAIGKESKLARIKLIDAETGECIGKTYAVNLTMRYAHTMTIEVSAHLEKAGAKLLASELNEVST